jgi:diacylglycerol kinase (ATP)
VPELLKTTCDPERVVIIFNPVSGTESGEARRAKLEALAEAAGLTCDLVETDAQRGAGPLAREAAAGGMERILVSGGDGSVTEAAGALAGTHAALAVVPGGTGNLLALNLGIPADPAQAMRLALTGNPRPIDVGRANGQVFLMMAGMGADARMIRDADRETKKRLGILAYFIAAWRNSRRPRSLYTITIDGREIRRNAQTVLIANLGRITAGLELVPGADPDDGLLEVAIVRTRRIRDVAAVALGALLGLPRRVDLLEIHQGRNIVIETVRPQPVQLDGNEAGRTSRLEIRVEPAALQLVRLPPESEGPPLTPVTLIASRGSAAWAPLAAGLGVTGALCLRSRRLRARGREPGPFSRHPWLTGLGAAAALLLAGQVVQRLRKRARKS